MSLRFILFLGVALMLVGAAAADVPHLINYQGVLLDTAGDPVTIPTTVIFAIWNADVDGDSLWSEQQSATPDDQGRFAVLLGSVSPMPDSAFAGAETYLSVKVDTDPEMTPRQRFASVAYAYRGASADGALFADSTDAITDGGIDLADLGPNGAAENQIIKWNGAAWALAADETGTGGDNDWTLTGDVLYTGGEWGLARAGNVLYGSHDSTHVNLGVACTTGTLGEWHKYATVSGGLFNTASGEWAMVGGGGYNAASNFYAAVGGGLANHASGQLATVGGGMYDTASGAGATVGGGGNNIASATSSTIGGGQYNTASGEYATVGGGRYNNASGDYSFAAGRRAKANHNGTFVWGDATDADLATWADNQFLARASGGVTFYTNAGLTTGVTVPAGGGAWSSVSNREAKRNIRPVDGSELLEKLAQLEVSRWSYKTQDESIEHIGPMAQDFYRLFGVGDDNKTISTIDPDGIALAAIQELYKKTQKIEELEAQMAELQALVQKLLAERQ